MTDILADVNATATALEAVKAEKGGVDADAEIARRACQRGYDDGKGLL